MLCVRIRRERLWCSRPASKRSRQVRRLVDQTAWDPNLGLHAMCEHIERRKTRATTISHGVLGRRHHGYPEAVRRRLKHSREQNREGGAGQARGETLGVQGGLHALSCAVRPCRRRLPKVVTTRRWRSAVICLLRALSLRRRVPLNGQPRLVHVWARQGCPFPQWTASPCDPHSGWTN